MPCINDITMKINWKRLSRKVHYWGALLCALPVLIVIATGIPLLLRKEISWIQPATMVGQSVTPTISFSDIIQITSTVPEASITTWADVDRLDIRPNKGTIKVRSRNRWEVQLDQETGDILQVAYRRSGLIESIHEGTFFHEKARLGLFLPSAIILLILWVTGIYLFLMPYIARKKRKSTKSANDTLN
jgi:uncharacterized iron-regulated membrane protein